MKKTSNLKDVARLAEVSLGTASKVMNGIYVKPDLRIRVEEAAASLQYTPNVIARSLKLNSTKVLGIVIPDISSPVIGKVLKGIEDYNRQEGYNGIIYQTALETNQEKQAIETFMRSKVDGIIYIGNTVQEEIAMKLQDCRVPVVFIMTRYENGFFSSVTIDNKEAAFTAVDYLCQKGHKKILMLAGEENDPNAGTPRLEGYKSALEKHGIKIDDTMIYHGGYRLQRGYEDTMKLLQDKKEFTALFAVSDEVAVGAIKAFSEKGVKVPEEVSIIGFDGIEMIDYTVPSLSSISQPFYELGKEAANMLIDSMRNGTKDVQKILPFYLIENKSVMEYEHI